LPFAAHPLPLWAKNGESVEQLYSYFSKTDIQAHAKRM